MYDRETESLWVHVTGRAETGPRKGWQLDFLPSSMTSWAVWKAAHPNTTVLPGFRRGGFMGTYTGLQSPQGIGLVVRVARAGKLYPFEKLIDRPVVNDRFKDEDVVVVYSREVGVASAWHRRVGDQVLNFRALKSDAEAQVTMSDEETDSVWSAVRGVAVSGPLKGMRLQPLPHHPILNRRFSGFYEEGPVLD